MSKLFAYSVFHCNLAFSSIPEDDYPGVVERCYWPLLKLAESGLPVGVEATASTLKKIDSIDRTFIKRLGELWDQGRCEFIGSGYGQIIMPLAPARVNEWNLEAGNRVYREFFGRAPEVCYVNEQAYSRGVADIIRAAGYSTILMEWDNCHRYNLYPKDLLFYPQKAAGAEGEIQVLWNHSIAFQKFQRCVYGEVPEAEYLDYLFSRHSVDGDRAFLLYGNDAEVFNYRPGQGFLKGAGDEYARMERLFRAVSADGRAVLATPAEVLKRFKGHPRAYNRLRLESPETPVPVKKQEKYNPTRWAVTGRDSVHINTECHRAYNNTAELVDSGLPEEEARKFKEAVCELWGSDFRTNTIDEKFLYFQNRLGWLKLETERLLKDRTVKRLSSPKRAFASAAGYAPLVGYGRKDAAAFGVPAPKALIERKPNALKISTGAVDVEFIENKGCAIKSVAFPAISPEPLVGTLPHGYFEDIGLGADFFSGHLIHVSRDGKKTTDLRPVRAEVEEGPGAVTVSAEIPLEIGTLWKRYEISKAEPGLSVTYRLKVNGLHSSSLRLGIFTLIPSAFDRKGLWFETVNGGASPERFYPCGREIAHDEPVSQSVSASGCLGATEGWVRIGDGEKSITVHTDKSRLYSVPLLRFSEIPREDSFFMRLYHSIGEMDETAWWVWRGYNEITLRLSAEGVGRAPKDE